MTANATLEDPTLAALISSKICHDLAGQIGAINNGLELLEEESDDDTRYYALELIQNSAKAAWAQLDFNRLAFGVSSSLGAMVPVGHVEQVARRYVENGKRRLHWQVDNAELEKENAKLVLGLLAVALTALPAGGDFYVALILSEGENSRFKGDRARHSMPWPFRARSRGRCRNLRRKGIRGRWAARDSLLCRAARIGRRCWTLAQRKRR